jgi:probable poly-beta-1,6-N-acetyl-D-glucosamine export protein
VKQTLTDEVTLPIPAEPVSHEVSGQSHSDTAKVAPKRSARPHIYELDPLRATTAAAVVAVHTTQLTQFINHSDWGFQLQSAVLVALHYTREVFMFVTAFALVSVYYGKPLSATNFWRKRAIGVLVPYCIWTAIYVVVNEHPQSLGDLLFLEATNVFSGRASYQLYFILLSLQFYIIFPFFLPLVRFFKAHPWKTVLISGGIELVWLFVDFHTVQRGVFTFDGFWGWYSQYESSMLFVYQFYFILGAVVAVHFAPVRQFLLSHSRLVLGGFFGMFALLIAHYYVQIDGIHIGIDYAVSVLQPIMVPYSVATLALLFWLTSRWADNRDATGQPRYARLWRTLSDASFGVYLVHALILNWLVAHLIPAIAPTWPVPLCIVVTWVVTLVSATLVSIALMNTPVLSRLVGRNRPWPGRATKQRQMAAEGA